MPLWDVVPAVVDGVLIADDALSLITTDDGSPIGWDAGWITILAEVDAPV